MAVNVKLFADSANFAVRCNEFIYACWNAQFCAVLIKFARRDLEIRRSIGAFYPNFLRQKWIFEVHRMYFRHKSLLDVFRLSIIYNDRVNNVRESFLVYLAFRECTERQKRSIITCNWSRAMPRIQTFIRVFMHALAFIPDTIENATRLHFSANACVTNSRSWE